MKFGLQSTMESGNGVFGSGYGKYGTDGNSTFLQTGIIFTGGKGILSVFTIIMLSSITRPKNHFRQPNKMISEFFSYNCIMEKRLSF